MTPEQIAAARALVDAATPGPWRLGLKWDSVVADGSTGYDDQDTIDAYGGHLVCESAKLGPNARFVAWCRDGVPALLDALAAAEARAADLTANLEKALRQRDDYHKAALRHRDEVQRLLLEHDALKAGGA